MIKKILSSSAILASCTVMTACSLFLAKEGDGSKPAPDNRQKQILGSWKIVAVNCDASGSNCERYGEERVFRYWDNGEFSVNGEKRGAYRLSGSTCVLNAGDRQYTLRLLYMDSTRMITGENGRTTTEILNKIE